MRKLVFLHGISSGVISDDYAAPLVRLLKPRLDFQYVEVNYSDLGLQLRTALIANYQKQLATNSNWLDKLKARVLNRQLHEFLIAAGGQILEYENIKAEIVERVAEQAGADECSIVAHSLGTVVAFDALDKLNVRNFYTMGSPVSLFRLGLVEQAKYNIAGQWLNFFDINDPIACTWHDTFPQLVDVAVHNRGINPLTAHGGYWTNKQVAKKIADTENANSR